MTIRKPILAAVAAFALPLTACSTTPDPAPVADVSVTAPQSTTPPTTPELTETQKDRIFLQVVAEEGITGQQAIDTAHAICDALDAGNTPEAVALVVLDGFDGDTDQAGALLGAGIQAYCPQYSDAMGSIGGDPA
ncbi:MULTISPECIES: DUF732 domain-containing protein [Gordonia]|uniref:DUF732 domain-containing protein n=1 Tax=Gordonia sihwensis NBRC 108236 TaxID=1223544 RepID=L7LKK0_9ACTN|nr:MULTISPECIES: DUF732 domain-containing protein [Gordonia]AUH68487.1 DUF732 domain-containing protein [Gordonia sp. YC-JH1]GAC60612.1 hypothetical protein GSI01S_10_02040 [Gordonia sihwensis NBRC 108236]